MRGGRWPESRPVQAGGRLAVLYGLTGLLLTVCHVVGAEDGGTTAEPPRDFEPTPRTLFSHGSEIHSAALSPDGQLLATTDGHRRVILHDAETGRPLRVFDGHSDTVSHVAFSPSGETLATASYDNTVRLWETSTGRLRNVLRGHTNWVVETAFSPDGQTLATCGYDQTVRLWDTETGDARAVLKGHSAVVRSVAFLPDGKTLLSGGDDATLKPWDVPSGTLRTDLKASGPVRTVTVSPDGSEFAAGTGDGTVTLWDTSIGEKRRSLSEESELSSSGNAVCCLRFSPQGRMLAAGDDTGTITLWDVRTGRRVQTLRGPADLVSALAFAPDMSALYATSYNGTVIVFRASLPLTAPLAMIEISDGTSWAVDVSPDGETLAIGGRGGFVSSWSLKQGTRLRTVTGHPSTVDCVEFSPDGTRFATAGWRSQEVVLWETESGKRLKSLTAESPVRSISFSPDDRTLAAACKDGTVALWNLHASPPAPLSEGEGKGVRASIQAHELTAYDVAFSPDGTILATCSGDWTKPEPGEVALWDAGSQQELARFSGHERAVRSVTFHPKGTTLASVGHDGVVKLWDVAAQSEVATLRNAVGARPGAFSPDGTLLAVGLHDGTINVWVVAAGDVVRRLQAGDDVFGVGFSGDGSVVVAVDGNRRALLWQTRDGSAAGTAADVRRWAAGATPVEAPKPTTKEETPS